MEYKDCFYRTRRSCTRNLNEFKNLWMSPNSQYYEEFIEDYKEQYLQNQIIKKQQRQAAKEQIVDFESYKLKPIRCS